MASCRSRRAITPTMTELYELGPVVRVPDMLPWAQQGYVSGFFDRSLPYLLPHEREIAELLRARLDPAPGRLLQLKVRCSFLEFGVPVCSMPDWHLDHVTEWQDSRPGERHALWVSHAPPLFRSLDGVTLCAAPAETIVLYGRTEHRATCADRSGYRLMVRVSETDVRFPPLEVRDRERIS